MNPIELLRRLVDQIEKCNPTDDHGHDFKMNQAFINAKVAVRMVIPDELANLRGAVFPQEAALESEVKRS